MSSIVIVSVAVLQWAVSRQSIGFTAPELGAAVIRESIQRAGVT